MAKVNRCIARVGNKLKTASDIKGAVGHNARTRSTPNADPKGLVISPRDAGRHPDKTVMDRIAAAGVKPRADSVLAVEILLSVSPAYFRPDQPEAYGLYDKAKTKAWAEASWEWLLSEYGDRIVDAKLHGDEATPHFQAIVVPLTDDGRLSAFELFGDLEKFQDKAAAAVAHLGIERGVRGSKARHRAISDYYKEVNAPAPGEPAPIKRTKVPVPPLMMQESTRQAWADSQNQKGQDNLVMDRERYSREVKPHLVRSKAIDRLEREKVEAMATAEAANKRAEMAEEAARKAVERVEATKADVALENVLASYGLEIDDSGRWIGEGMVIKVEGAAWWDDGDRQARGRSAIDLAKHLRQVEYSQAVAWLRDNFGQAQAEQAVVVHVQGRAPGIVAEARPFRFEPPPLVEANWPRVRRWLTTVRRLAAELVDRLHGLGRVYADDRANAVFLLMDGRGRPVGAELKGTGPQPFTGMAAGTSRNAGAFMVPSQGPGRVPLVVVKSAIDAISYAQLHPGVDVEIRSTGGVRSQIPWLEPNWDLIVVAFDADNAGDKAAAALLAGLRPGQGYRDRPAGAKDWNDLVRNGSLDVGYLVDRVAGAPTPASQPHSQPSRAKKSDDPAPS
ncbi:MobV family relaxase [Nitrospirillum sp. BR 11828]|uniref:MobV family relaxase n=1 Tax=Nitrospirillum sp. BR 11828 TaxID=3104325 RepID=UPI002ACAD808|nr:MobV family relaxase [Nitrospirillum sp. BR 11828]MDZ5649420.1 MobV family relaxase [Nitrospirillum sp. BR 11828]